VYDYSDEPKTPAKLIYTDVEEEEDEVDPGGGEGKRSRKRTSQVTG